MAAPLAPPGSLGALTGFRSGEDCEGSPFDSNENLGPLRSLHVPGEVKGISRDSQVQIDTFKTGENYQNCR